MLLLHQMFIIVNRLFGFGCIPLSLVRQVDSSENPLGLARKHDSRGLAELEVLMSKQRSFLDYEEHLGAILSKGDDPLEKLSATVDFERFRPILDTAAGRPRGAKGGRRWTVF